MTRETKIGLLVGLAFVIVIGILLSDHWSSQAEPAQAPLGQMRGTMMLSMGTPGGSRIPAAAPAVPGTVEPGSQVPTSRETTSPRPQRETRITIGGGAGDPIEVRPAPNTNRTDTTGLETAGNSTPGNTDNGNRAGEQGERAGSMSRGLEQLVQQTGQELVPVDPGNGNRTPARPAPSNEYRAVAGDSLSKMAGKLPGGNTKANRDAIVKLNPSLQSNPDFVVVGRAYVMPTSGTGPAPAPVGPAATTRPARPAVGGETTYTVKRGETLWGIARDQLGDPKQITVIKELNKEALRGTDNLKEGQKLRLPAKASVASAAPVTR